MTRWAVPLAYVVVALVVRAPALLHVELNWDEALYWMIAGDMRAGHAPYAATWDRKPPGLFALLAAMQALGGESMLVLRLGTTLGVAVTALALRAVGRLLLPSLPAAGTMAGFIYIAGSLPNNGDATNSELLLAPFAAAGVALALAAARSGAIRPALAAGALFGAAALIKQVALFDALAAGLMVAVLPWAWGDGPSPNRRLALLAGMAAGGAVPLLATAGAYAAIGKLDLLAANTLAASSAGGAAFNTAGLWAGAARLRPLLAGAALGLAALVLVQQTRERLSAALAVAIWLACVAAVLVLLGRFADHMFHQLVPPLALGTAALVAVGCRLVPAHRLLPRPHILVQALAVLALLAWGTASHLRGGAETVWRRASGGIAHWGDRTATLAAAIGPRIAGPHDVLVVGRTLGVYAATATRPATRFPFPLHLWEGYAPIDGTAELERILATRPRFVVVDELWLPGGPRYSDAQARILDRLATALAEAYVPDGRVGRFNSWGGGFVGAGVAAVVFRRADVPPWQPGQARIQYDPAM